MSYLEKHDIHWLGGECTTVDDSRLVYVEDFRTLDKNSVFWSEDIPALTRAQAEQLIALFKKLVTEGRVPYSRFSSEKGVNTDDSYARAIASLKGGTEFLQLIDPMEHQQVYDKIIGVWCWTQVLKTILKWLGRSIKGESYQS